MVMLIQSGCTSSELEEPRDIKVREVVVDEYFRARLEKAQSKEYYGYFVLYKHDLTAEVRLGERLFRNYLKNFDFIKYEGNSDSGLVSYQLGEAYGNESFGIAIFRHSEWEKVLKFIDDWPKDAKSKFITKGTGLKKVGIKGVSRD